MLLRSGDNRIPARLRSFEGASLGFTTSAWLSPAEVFQACVEGPDGQLARAMLMIRSVELDDERPIARCTALITGLALKDRELISRWVEAAPQRVAPPPPDPLYEAAPDNRSLRVRWDSPETFLAAWDGGLAQGRLPLPASLSGASGRPRLTLQLPDGGSLPLPPVRVASRAGQLTADLRVLRGPRKRLAQTAEWARQQLR